ncbi:hypothetical protein ACQP3J_34115, partial [Escherichia coli]
YYSQFSKAYKLKMHVDEQFHYITNLCVFSKFYLRDFEEDLKKWRHIVSMNEESKDEYELNPGSGRL